MHRFAKQMVTSIPEFPNSSKSTPGDPQPDGRHNVISCGSGFQAMAPKAFDLRRQVEDAFARARQIRNWANHFGQTILTPARKYLMCRYVPDQ